MGLVEEDLRGGAAVLVDLFDIGKGVEGPGGRIAGEADLIEPGDEQVAANAILLAARSDLRLRGGERLHHGVLHGRGDAVGGVEHDLAQSGHEGLFGDGIAGAPAGHGIGLRKRETGDGALGHSGQRGDGDVFAVVDEVFVGFVGDDDQIAFDGEGCHFFSFGAGEDEAAGILRRVVVDGACLRRRKLLERLADSVAARGDGGNQQRPRLRAGDEIADGSPIGREDQGVIAGIEHALEGCVEALRAADGDDHFVGGDVDFVFGGKLLRPAPGADGKQAGRRSVVGLVFDQRADGGELDVIGRLEEGLAAVQRVHLEPLGAHGHHLVANLHDVGEANLVEPPGQPNSA